MPQSLQRIWIRLTADRRRFGILVAMVLVGLLLWGRVIIVSSPPRRAVAGSGERLTQKPAETPRGGSASSENPPAPPREVALASEMTRDPFRINPQHFPRPTPPAKEARDDGKSGSSPADDEARDEALRVGRIEAAARNLTLEAVMKGASLAVIDGRTLRVGDSVSSPKHPGFDFTLIEVGDRSAVLECEGIRVELRLSAAADRTPSRPR